MTKEVNDSKRDSTATEPTVAPAVEQHAPAPKKTGPHAKYIILAVVLALVVVLLAAAAWVFLVLKDGSSDTRTANGDRSAAAVVEYIGEDAFFEKETESIGHEVVTVTAMGGQTSEGFVLYDFAPYRVSGASYYSLPATGSGEVYRVDTKDAETSYAAITKSLEKLGYSAVSNNESLRGGLGLNTSTTIESYDIFSTDEAICSVARLSGAGSTEKQLISIGCASVADYRATSTAVKPFYEAYRLASSSMTNSVVFSNPEIVDDANGAKRASVYQQNSSERAVHTYVQSGESGWTYSKKL